MKKGARGLRIGEIIDLRWRYVDLICGVLLVRNGKGGKSRVLAITDSPDQQLKTWRRQQRKLRSQASWWSTEDDSVNTISIGTKFDIQNFRCNNFNPLGDSIARGHPELLPTRTCHSAPRSRYSDARGRGATWPQFHADHRRHLHACHSRIEPSRYGRHRRAVPTADRDVEDHLIKASEAVQWSADLQSNVESSVIAFPALSAHLLKERAIN